MNPDTPAGLPIGSTAYLGRVEGKDGGMVVFSKDNYQVCSIPMNAPAPLLKLLDDVDGRSGDAL